MCWVKNNLTCDLAAAHENWRQETSNWPPDVNQIVFHWPPRRSIWKFTARVSSLVFSDLSENWLGEIEKRNCFSSQWRRSLVSTSHASGRRIGSHPGPDLNQIFFFNLVMLLLLLFFFSTHSFIGIDSDIFFLILELIKEAWECGSNNNNIEKNGKDTDSSALCPHW